MNSVSVKVCGITRTVDAGLALELGAEKLGFIIHEKSPRKISFSEVDKIKAELSLDSSKMVAVEVTPDLDHLKQIQLNGFGIFQLHFPYDYSREIIKQWSDLVGPDNLWLAPRLPTGIDFPEDILPYANTFLIDAYSKDKFGGTGELSDWKSFSHWSQIYNSKKWILAGGISPGNIQDAMSKTKSSHYDVNSGIELTPGIKDPNQMRNLFSKLFTNI